METIERQTHTTWKGNEIDLLAGPRIDQIDVEEIAHQLAMQCRFNGAVNRFYSVAEHSLYCAIMAPRRIAVYALLHDAHEYIYQDISAPNKKVLFKDNLLYKKLCEQCDQSIMKALDLNYTGYKAMYADIKAIDLEVYKLECKFLRGRNAQSPNLPSSHPLHGMPFGMTWEEAKAAFVQYFSDATA